jgi:hypothetical protein
MMEIRAAPQTGRRDGDREGVSAAPVPSPAPRTARFEASSMAICRADAMAMLQARPLWRRYLAALDAASMTDAEVQEFQAVLTALGVDWACFFADRAALCRLRERSARAGIVFCFLDHDRVPDPAAEDLTGQEEAP